MIELTLVGGEIMLSPEIVLFKELKDLYDMPKVGNKLLQTVYYMYSTSTKNPFNDNDDFVKERNVFQAVFKKDNLKALKLPAKTAKLYEAAVDLYQEMTFTPESRMMRTINKKLDEISRMLDNTVPAIEESVTKNGEVKYNSNLGIILNMFTKVETVMKAKDKLQDSIRKRENAGRIRGGGKSSFREKGLIK